MRNSLSIRSAIGVFCVSLVSTAESATLIYDGSALPDSSWNFVSNGNEDHTVYASDGSLRMIDATLLLGNSLGYIRPFEFDSSQHIDITFRARVFSGQAVPQSSPVNQDYRSPFSVWLHDGQVRAGMEVGPDRVTSLGPLTTTSRPYTEEELQELEAYAAESGIPLERLIGDGNVYTSVRTYVLDYALNGADWHTYNFRLTPGGITWYIDGFEVGQASRSELLQNIPTTDLRINMLITSATADVELDYLTVTTSAVPLPSALWLMGSGLVSVLGAARRAKRGQAAG